MSTKIYDAYALKDEYNLFTLNDFLVKLRKDVTELCEQKIFDRIVRKTLYYYNFKQLHGNSVVKSMIRQTDNDDQRNQSEIWKHILANEWNSVYINTYFRQLESITDTRKFICNFRAKLQLIPINDKILVMFFGDHEIRNYLESTNYFVDYHYQNQCDRPENISESEWNRRCKDWDKAIGPDYIPSHHGWSVDLFDADNSLPVFSPENNKKYQLNFPEIDSCVKSLRETLTSISKVPGYPGDTTIYSQWETFMQSDEYRKWVAESDELIKSKCNFITTKDEFIRLLRTI